MVESFSGIRGVYGVDLKEEIFKAYACSFSSVLSEKFKKPNLSLVIGRDSRASGQDIFQVLSAVLTALGHDIFDVGIKSTPVVEEAVRALRADGGIIITASHNPPEHNGLKFLEKRGNVLYPLEMQEVIRQSKLPFSSQKNVVPGRIIKKHEESANLYIQFLEKTLESLGINKDIFTQRRLNILLDPNGGAMSLIGSSILSRFGIKNLEINNELGNFYHQIEPNQESLAYLQTKLVDFNLDFAGGFDCDADRIELVSKKYGVISGQLVLGLLVEYFLKYKLLRGSKKVVINDATSYLVRDIVNKYGYQCEEVEVGEVNVVSRGDFGGMIIGGEGSSGGVIVSPSRCRDGILTLLLVVSYLNQEGISLEEAIDRLPKYCTMVGKVTKQTNYSVIKLRLLEYSKNNNLQYRETGDNYGGIKIFKNNGWFWFRGSRTENGVIRLIADSPDQKETEALFNQAQAVLNEII